MTHPLDHLVLPTRDLETARARLGALGFTVAPQGTHPFGTINCCVYFGGGTFLEPLAIGDVDTAGQAADAGNVFVGRDRTFRTRNGDEGFSAVVFGTDDADADHERYVAADISAGQRLDFSRPFFDSSGKQDTASFRLAFAAAPDMADAFTFACERANVPKVDRTALQTHANGVSAIREVVGVSDDIRGKLRLLAEAADAVVDRATGASLELPNARLSLIEPNAFERRFGLAAKSSSLRFAAIVFAASDVKGLARRLAEAGIDHHFSGASLIVPPALGQGAAFVFEESA
ncbi:VOC family protein [Mesorhizobium sp. 8]|uniref:VOC family protein n=1 Tax=Mesorhizobium sp. 8 TaxID=2584466 RepID=UPI00111EFC96|nr:VOC family protein [Mesorhizobium sp. 8]QDB99592.1 VOC family protein [Mesorhizobium sp. 8]